MGEVRDGGYRWDTGPSVITLRPVFEQVFHDAGRDLRDYLELIPLNPITRYFWPDGLTIDAVADEDAMCANLRASFGPHAVDDYRTFMRYARQLYDAVSQPFLYRAKPVVRDLIRLPLGDVFKIDALRTMHAAIQAHFTDPHLIQLFDRFATYNGSSPYRAPATLNVISYIEMAQGAWYPRGGVYQLAQAFERLALELGVELRYGEKVERIDVKHGQADGITLSNGQNVRADAVVCNADYTHAQRTLFSAAHPPRDISRLEPSGSGFALLVKAEGHQPELAHHNVFFCDDYRCEFQDIFDRRVAPLAPTLYVCITSKTDPGHAPPGCENPFVLVNAPYISERYDWHANTTAYAQAVLDQLRRHIARVGRSEALLYTLHAQCVMTPADLQATYGGNRGAIYGFSSNSRRAAFIRPANRDPHIKRLYFAGGSVHPGGGVPLVTLSGMAAAKCALEDLRGD